jgi:Reverse transcriptase (RNA-dependent DNA polymerase)
LELAAGNTTNEMQDTTNSPLRVNVSNPINDTDVPTAMDIDNDPPIINDNTTINVSDIHQESERIITRLGREASRPKRYGDYVSYQVSLDSAIYEPTIEDTSPVTMAVTSDPYTIYYHEILNQLDKHKFIEAMEREIDDHNGKGHWKLVRKNELEKGTRVLPSVWAMRRKRDLSTGDVVKWKARLNVDGSKQQAGIDYDQTYAPVTSWVSVRLILILAVLQGWMTKQLDFVQAYPQAPVEQDLYIDVQKGCNIGREDTSKWALQVLKSIYGQKQAGKVWHDYLIQRLTKESNFAQCIMDPCILWRGKVIIINYLDYTIITGPNAKDIDIAIADISSKFSITSKDTVSDFFGVHKQQKVDGTIEMTQPTLIQSILNDLGLKEDSNTTQLPAPSTRILRAHHDISTHAESWRYR